MVVVVADAILEAGRRPGGLNAPDEAGGDQDPERVVHRLERDRPDLGPDDHGRFVGRGMRPTRDRSEDRQSLGRDLDTALPKEVSGGNGHDQTIDQIVD